MALEEPFLYIFVEDEKMPLRLIRLGPGE
jgi:hypothetical protein